MTLGVNQVTANTQTLLIQLQQLESAFEQSAIDQENWFNRSDVFISSAFYTKSNELADYFSELKGNISKLERLKEPAYLEFLADKVTQQFACLKSLLNSAQIDGKERKYKQKHKARIQQTKQFAKRVTQSSQSLYAELSQLQEFERRLLDMVSERQQRLHQYQGTKHRQEYQQEVLTYQQRLGRCRQAISKVEEQIQKLDDKR